MENKAELLKILNYSNNYSQTKKLSDLRKDIPYDIIELRKIKYKIWSFTHCYFKNRRRNSKCISSKKICKYLE